MTASLTAALRPPVTLPRAIVLAGVLAAVVLFGASARWSVDRAVEERAVVWLQPSPPPAPVKTAPPAPATERPASPPPVDPPKSDAPEEPRPKPPRASRAESVEPIKPFVIHPTEADVAESPHESPDAGRTAPAARAAPEAAPAGPPAKAVDADPGVARGPIDATVACAHRVRPKMPEETDEDVPGVDVVVLAEASLQDGRVTEVRILNGPRRYHRAVRQAMLQYSGCQARPGQAILQEFRFNRNDPVDASGR